MKKRLSFLVAACLVISLLSGIFAETPQYVPGTYETSAKGYGGNVNVSLTVDEKGIVDLQIVGASETESIGGAAIEKLKEAILAAGNADQVDAITKATLTSDAVIAAVKDAFILAKGGELTAPAATPVQDGTFTGTAPSYQRSGHESKTVTVTATFENGKVTKIASSDYSDTPGIGGMAFDVMAERVIRTQSLGLDTLTGATVSSSGFLSAMGKAVAEAGGNPEEWKSRAVVKRAPQVTEMSSDVVVVGAGIAGLSAAVEAATLGAKVILVEKEAVLNSSTTRSEGFIQGAGTQFQKDNGVEDTQEAFYKDIMEVYGQEPTVEAELIEYATMHSAELIQFMIDNGVVFGHLEAISKNPPRDVPRNHCVQDGGSGITTALYKSFLDKGGIVLLGTPCTQLITDGKAVIGIKATNVYGDDITIRAKATIMAAGSYTANNELFKQLNPKQYFAAERVSGSGTGDAYYLGQSVNADMLHLDFVQQMYYFYSKNLSGWPSVIPGAPLTSVITPATDLIYLSGGGERIANEDEFCFDYIDKNFHLGYDEGWALAGKAFQETHPDVIEIGLTSTLTFKEGAMCYTGDTIEEVAEQAGLDAKVVQATLDRYNELCDKGVDEDFDKPAQYMVRVDPPYYLLRMPLILTDGYDGMRVNINAQVIDTNGNVIPGFYAAGSCAVAQMSSVRYYGCGTSLLLGGVYGRVAAQQAVADK